MSAETFVFTQLQSGALPTELSEVVPPTRLHYLTLIKPYNSVWASSAQAVSRRERCQCEGSVVLGRRLADEVDALEWVCSVRSVKGWLAERGREITTSSQAARVAVM